MISILPAPLLMPVSQQTGGSRLFQISGLSRAPQAVANTDSLFTLLAL